MHAVGIRELKNKLSEYIRLVRAGEVITVTDRGEVVAELGPPGRRVDDLPPGVAELVRRGLATRIGLPNSADAYPEMPRSAPDGTALALLDAERGER